MFLKKISRVVGVMDGVKCLISISRVIDVVDGGRIIQAYEGLTCVDMFRNTVCYLCCR